MKRNDIEIQKLDNSISRIYFKNKLFFIDLKNETLAKFKNPIFILENFSEDFTSTTTNRKLTYIYGQLPLLGTIYFGFRDWPSNVIEVRPLTGCINQCIFCSVREGPREKYWKRDFYVDVDYLVEWAQFIVKEKQVKYPNFYINPQGEPVLYYDLPELVQQLSSLGIVGITTTLVNTSIDYIEDLIDAGLSYINVSLHSLDPNKSKFLTGNYTYDVNKIIDIIEAINGRIEITLTPVITKYNIEDLEELVKFAMRLDNKRRAKIVPQIYMVYKHGRKLKPSVRIQYNQYNKILENLEKKYSVPLRNIPLELVDIIPGNMLRSPIRIGEKFKVKKIFEGRRNNEYLTEYKNRVVVIYSNDKEFDKARITSTKGNIYIAEAL